MMMIIWWYGDDYMMTYNEHTYSLVIWDNSWQCDDKTMTNMMIFRSFLFSFVLINLIALLSICMMIMMLILESPHDNTMMRMRTLSDIERMISWQIGWLSDPSSPSSCWSVINLAFNVPSDDNDLMYNVYMYYTCIWCIMIPWSYFTTNMIIFRSFLFFFMLINLALSSICAGVQTFVAFILDEKPEWTKLDKSSWLSSTSILAKSISSSSWSYMWWRSSAVNLSSWETRIFQH